MSENSNPYNDAMQRLKSLGGFYEEHVNRTLSPVTVEIPQQNEVDVNFVPAAIGAAAGIPQALYRTLRPTPAPAASVADIARTVAAEGVPAGGAPSGVPLQRATGRGAGVINYANQVTPELTNLEASKAGDYKQVWEQNRRAQATADLTKGFRPGENLMLPREVMEEQAARQAVEAQRAARPTVGNIVQSGLRQAGNVLGKGMPIVGGGLAGYELAEALDEYNRGEPLNAAISGLGGVGGLMMMSRNPMKMGAGALMTVPSLVRSGYRSLNKPE
jgi:hypothetical protein